MEQLRKQLAEQKNRVIRTLAQKVNNPTQESTPVFLVGCGRSGTSMMVLQLGKTWQVDVFNENHPDAFDKWFLRGDEVIQKLTAKSRAPAVVFKPILETFRVRSLLTTFPEAKVLFAFRHYDDVINSSLKKFGAHDRINHLRDWMSNDFQAYSAAPPPQSTRESIRSLWDPAFGPVEGAALFWLFTNRLYFDLGLHEDQRAMLLQYEDFIARPKQNLQRICRFLGIQFEETMMAGIRKGFVRRDPAPVLDEQVRKACQQLWDDLCRTAEIIPTEG